MIRDFKEHHLGQIKTVYPSAYTFRQETGLPIAGGNRHTSQLTVEANLGKNYYKLSCLCLPLVPKYIALQYKSFCVCGSATSFLPDELPGQQTRDVKVDKYGRPVLTTVLMTARSATFHRKLIAIVKKYHQVCCCNMKFILSNTNKYMPCWEHRIVLFICLQLNLAVHLYPCSYCDKYAYTYVGLFSIF